MTFANDLLLLAEASMEQLRTIQDVLELFKRAYGRCVSEAKTIIYFSRNVNERSWANIQRINPYWVTNDLV